MDAYDFYASLHDLLELTAEVSVQEGLVINTGENFTVEFTIRNVRPRRRGVLPKVVFRNVHLSVRGTEHATLYGSAAGEYDASSPLGPGDKTVFPVGFRARQPMGGMEANYTQELVAKASVTADLDLAEFFKFKQKLDLRAEIKSSE